VPHGTGAERPRAAVVGSGVASLTAAYLLQRAYDVTLYEADDRLGGHAHSHDIAADDGPLVTLDSGFIVTTRTPTRTCCGCLTSSGSAPATAT
jgi:uncharacterized protein